LGGGDEGDEDIYIAVVAEIVAQDGTKEGEFGDLPAITKLSDFSIGRAIAVILIIGCIPVLQVSN
jgi:hypothetical protein